jgi:hypothetical protein
MVAAIAAAPKESFRDASTRGVVTAAQKAGQPMVAVWMKAADRGINTSSDR